MRTDKKTPQKSDKKTPFRAPKRGLVGYSKKSALLEEAITHMNTGKYGRSSAVLKELLTLDPHNTEARRLFATLHLRLGSLVTARQAFESLANEAIGRQDFWLAESLLREYLAAGPRCVPFLELLAHVYEEKGDTMAAVAELGKAIDILLEDPIPENPKKPSELYAKVRAIEPASPVAFQFASLFDIQTGELLAAHLLAPHSATLLEVVTVQPQDEELATTEEREPSDVTSRELFAGAPLSPETLSPAIVNSVIESFDVPSESALSSLGLQGLEVSPSELERPNQEVNSLDQSSLSSISDQSNSEREQSPVSIEPEPEPSSCDSREDVPVDLIVEPSSFAGEAPATSSPESFPEERIADVGIAITATVGSLGLSSPMPWEQIEDSTIRIEAAAPSTTPLAQPEGAPLFGSESFLAFTGIAPSESVSEQVPSSAPMPDPSELTCTVDQAANPAILSEPESLTPSVFTHPDLVAEQLASSIPALALTELSESVMREGLIPRSLEEQTPDVGTAITDSSVGAPALSSPMPWEQIEDSTIRIEAAAPSTTPLAQPEGAPLFGSESFLALSAIAPSEPVSEQMPSSAPVPEPSGLTCTVGPPPSSSVLSEPEIPTQTVTAPSESVLDQLAKSALETELPEPSELTLTVDQPVNPEVLPEPEVPAPSAADASSAAPYSWNTVFDGTWKFATGTSSSNSPAAFSNQDAISQDAREVESVQPESVPEPECSAPSMTSTQELSCPPSDSGPLPLTSQSILSPETESIAATDSSRETDLSGAAVALISEEPSRPEETPTSSSDVSCISTADLPASTVPEPVERILETESVSSPSFEAMQPAAVLSERSAPWTPDFAVVLETSSAPEPDSLEHHEIPMLHLQAPEAPPLPAAPGDVPSAFSGETDAPSHWSTGEVAVQTHRPTAKKQNWDKEKGETTVIPPTPLSLVEESPEPVAELLRSGGWESAPPATPVVEVVAPVVGKAVPLQEDARPDWAQASDSITFVKFNPLPPPAELSSGIEAIHSQSEPVASVAASALDVLFDSTGQKSQDRTQGRLVLPSLHPRIAARVRIGTSSLLGSCFSTTQSIAMSSVALGLSCAALVVIGIGAVGLAWLVMEEPPSPVYQSLTTSSPQAHTDLRKNGYFLLLGFEAPAERDPLQAGYERRIEESDLEAANACMVGDERKGITTAGTSANVIRGWFASADPMAQMKRQAETVRSLATQESTALMRYQRWLSMPFDDVGYGQIVSPNCSHILLAHRLYLAEGFAQDLTVGLDRLETDMGSWRVALGQSKTLMVKMLAATAIQDDVAIASGLLLRQDLDGTSIGRLGKIVRPLDQVELSIRWPMQSHFLWATKTVKSSLKNDKANERPLYVALAAAMPLPVQRRSNDYADYYETANKAVAEGRYTNLPKLSGFIRTPAVSMLDYLANPIEHIIGIEPLPSWDPYVGRIVEIDARLRLAGLQAWIRRGTQEGNVLTRLAKAGQAHYDPFTGLPMLVNRQKGVMYSVGQDGKDQDGDPQRDVVVKIPIIQPSLPESPRATSIR